MHEFEQYVLNILKIILSFDDKHLFGYRIMIYLFLTTILPFSKKNLKLPGFETFGPASLLMFIVKQACLITSNHSHYQHFPMQAPD